MRIKTATTLFIIGALFALSSANAQTPYQAGPGGGAGGGVFSDLPDSASDKICRITGWTDSMYVNGIQVSFCTPSGQMYSRDIHGRSSGTKKVFNLAADEYITGVCGATKTYNGDPVLNMFNLTTSKTRPTDDGLFGIEETNDIYTLPCSFNFSATKGYAINGLLGASGFKLDSIGIHQTPTNLIGVAYTDNVLGPVGSTKDLNGEQFFTDVTSSGDKISEVIVFSGSSIDAIQVGVTRSNGTQYYFNKHGGAGGTPNSFKLDADEGIIAIRGYYNKDNLAAVSFVTNKQTSPMYGSQKGRSFSVEVPTGNIVSAIIGHASSSKLRSIGEYATASAFSTPPVTVTPPVSAACAASGKGGQFVASITLVANQSGNNSAQVSSVASSAGAYCGACNLTSSNINNLIRFSCGYGN